jgi:hypothetical protein
MLGLRLLVSVALSSTGAWQAVPIASTEGPSQLAIADMDQDGDLDVVGLGRESLAWARNDGAAAFSVPQVLDPAAYEHNSFTLEDLDGNGVVDIISALDDGIQWYPSLASSPVRLPFSGFTSTIAAGDLDGDGDTDLVVGADGSSLWLENADGVFGNAIEHLLLNEWSWAGAADLDADGTDEAILCGDFGLQVWSSNTLRAEFTDECNAEVVIRDVDGDLDLDLFVSVDPGQDSLQLYRNQGGFVFDREVVVEDHWAVGQSVLDLDRDGDLDFSYTKSFSGFCWVETTDAGFVDMGCPFEDTQMRVLASGDLDGDGFEDLIGAEPGPIYFPDLLSGALPEVVWSAAADTSHAADIDGDGFQDYVKFSVDMISCHYGSSTGLSDEKVLYFGPITPKITAATDFDGDTDVDLLMVDWLGGIFVLTNTNGEFSAPEEVAEGDHGFAGSFVDLDLDGDLDLVSEGFGPGGDYEIWVAERRGGSFQPVRRVADKGYQEMWMAAGDVDGDGILDLLLPAVDGVQFLRGTGSMEFGAGAPISEKESDFCTLVDVDGDADLDSLCSEVTSVTDWMENRGGTWIAPQRFDPLGCTTLVEADLDNDGDADLAGTSRNGELVWFERSGGLLPPVVLAEGVIGTLLAVDFNRDAGIDLVSPTAAMENPWYSDHDLDGLTDDEELVLGTDPYDNDSDEDGVGDLDDRCHGSPDQEDVDLDGAPDGCDACIGSNESGDADEDGFCALDVGGAPVDCDETDALVWPGAPERCNGQDDGCAGAVPADELDLDEDGYAACAGDCDDQDPARAIDGCEGTDANTNTNTNTDAKAPASGGCSCSHSDAALSALLSGVAALALGLRRRR